MKSLGSGLTCELFGNHFGILLVLQTFHEINYELIDLSGVFPKNVMTGMIERVKFGPSCHRTDYVK